MKAAFGKVAGFVGRSISPFHNLGSTIGQLTWIGIIGTGVALAVGGAPALAAAGGALKTAFGAVASTVQASPFFGAAPVLGA